MPNIFVKTGFSPKRDEFAAVKEVFKKIQQENMKLIIMFVDAGYDQLKVNQAWRKKVPQNVPFVGSSSVKLTIPFMKMTKLITPEGFKEGMAAMSISSNKIEATVKLMKNIESDWEKESGRALTEAAKDFELNLKNIDPKKYFGLFLCDGLRGVEDHILENIYGMSNLLCVGGGASGKFSFWDAVRKKMAYGCIHTEKGVFTDAAALALVKSEVPFKIELTTSFSTTRTKFEITKAEGRTIHELNGKPAAKEYAKALGVSSMSLGTKDLANMRLLMKHPLGLMIKDRAFIRSVMNRQGNSLVVGANVKNGQSLFLMQRGDIISTTQEAMSKLRQELGQISGMVLFQCGYRFLEADILKVSDDLFEAINVAPSIGLDAYGEYYGWLSMNQTLTILAFGD